MAEYKMGFIGTGNMGSALARAAAKSGERMLLANRTLEKAEALAAVLGAKVGTNLQAAAACEYIFLGVKPQMLPALLDELRPALLERTDRFLLVSMAAGVKTGRSAALGFDCPVVRIMPNLPVASGTGVILLSAGAQVKEDELCELERLLQAAGLLMRLPEAQIDAGSAVSRLPGRHMCICFWTRWPTAAWPAGCGTIRRWRSRRRRSSAQPGRPSPPASTRASSRPRSAARPGRRSRASARSSSAASAPPPWTPSSPLLKIGESFFFVD